MSKSQQRKIERKAQQDRQAQLNREARSRQSNAQTADEFISEIDRELEAPAMTVAQKLGSVTAPQVKLVNDAQREEYLSR